MEGEIWIIIRWYIYDSSTPISAQTKSPVHSINIPRSMLERWHWLIHWRTSKYRYFNPRKLVHTVYSYYEKKTGANADYNSNYTKWVSAKAQVTKVKNLIERYKQEQEKTLFAASIETDPIYIKLAEKLQNKEMLLDEAKRLLDQEILTIINNKKTDLC